MGGTDRPAGFLASRLTGAQTGAVLAFVSSSILGQYDPFFPGGGELLLVYPNVVAVERQLRVTPADFRLWVCLHEVTHRVQFTVNPWLAGYMSDALAVLTGQTSPDLTQVVGGWSATCRATTANPGRRARRESWAWCGRCSPNRSAPRWTSC